MDTEVQAYIKALTKAGTPVNVNIVLAAAEGVVPAVDRTLIFSFSQMSSEPQKLYLRTFSGIRSLASFVV